MALLGALALSLHLDGQPVSRGFDHFYNLEYDACIAEFERAIGEKPAEPQGYNHLAQGLLYREMFKAGALESEMVTGANPFLRRGRLEPPADVEKRFLEAIAKAMSLSQAALASNPRDVGATYALGVAHGLRGNWNFLVRKAYMDSLRDLTASRKLATKAVELDPKLIDARIILGLHDYVLGSLPAYMKMLGFLAGFRGDRQAGVRTIQEVAAKGITNSADAKVLLGVIYRRERRSKEAIPLLDDLIQRFPRNYLFRMELAQMWADEGDKAKSLAAIETLEQVRRSGVTGYGTLSAEKIAFARGNILFWYDDFERAIENLKAATAGSDKLDLHTASMAWLRLGQTYDLRLNRTAAQAAYRQVLQLNDSSDMAKEAKRYLGSPYKRPPAG
ncbi:MAG: tetratricopeptide repeat protein [Acidobacteria bacterium]|nr:tetratricopeptide repeat protein [Acidobacteriota bacterium]